MWLTSRTGLVWRGRNAFDNRERLVEQHALVVVDDCIHLRLDAIPNLVKSFLAGNELVPQPFEVGLNTELVV